ncbi:linear gramicidin synthetase subunit D domain protein [Mycobacterium xenopi 3993]|nr:linear gramicidin synthetase subunit D domain protein [Mycobacterium xenopi 3993]
MRLIAAVNTGLDAGLTVRAVFETPTVAGLASRIGGTRAAPAVGTGGAAGGGPTVVRPAAVVGPRPIARPSPVYNMAAALQLRGRLTPRRWPKRWPMWSAATRACARNSLRPRAYPSSWWCRRACRFRLADSRCHPMVAAPAQRCRQHRGALHVRPGHRDSFAGKAFPHR